MYFRDKLGYPIDSIKQLLNISIIETWKHRKENPRDFGKGQKTVCPICESEMEYNDDFSVRFNIPDWICHSCDAGFWTKDLPYFPS